MKDLFRKISHLIVFGHKSSSDMYINYLRKHGASIGEGARFFDSTTIKVDEGDLHMLTIGKNFQCTGGVNILTHDYGWCVLKGIYGEILGSIRPVVIGDNVYVGRNAMILAGTTIGDNVIIGANSVVTGNIPSNCVAIGSPCKPIYSIEEYYRRRLDKQEREAVDIARNYFQRFHTAPPIEVFSEYFWVFTNDMGTLPDSLKKKLYLMHGSEEKTIHNFQNHKPVFNGYEEFLAYALKE